MTYLINMTSKINFNLSERNLFSFRKMINVHVILCILATTLGCNSSNEKKVVENTSSANTSPVLTSSDLTLFQSAKTQWDSHSGQFYTIQSQRYCECVGEVSAQIKISVSDNLVLTAFDLDSNEVISKEVQQQIQTVDSLFDLIEKAIEDGTSIEVIYNEEFGYPETAKIDLEELAVDGGLFIQLSNLEIKESVLALDDVTWVLESFDSIAGPRPVIENTSISLLIDMENKELHGMGGCNSYSADFILDDKTNDMTISNLISTEKVCSEPANIMEQEENYFAILQQIQFFTLSDTILNMVAGGDSGLHFVVEQNFNKETEIEQPSNELVLLQSAKTQWDSHSGQYYTIQSQRYCECEDEVSAQMEISVLDNSVLSAFDMASGELISVEIQQALHSVDSLFTIIENAIAEGISIEVIYNQEYGYPESTKIDLEQIPVDGGLFIQLSNLEIKDSVLALDDVTWVLESFDSIAGQQPIIENTSISLSFDMENMQLNGIGGCNSYSADFVVDNKNHDITISNIISTEKACGESENIMQQEQSYFATLQQIRFFNLYSATLNMTVGADAGLNFVVSD
jgi:heat shock protein HslJ